MVVLDSLGASFLLSWPLVLLGALLSPVVSSQRLYLLITGTDRLEYGVLRRTQSTPTGLTYHKQPGGLKTKLKICMSIVKSWS